MNDLDRAMVDFERKWWRHGGSKEEAIHTEFGLNPTGYYQLLNALLDRPEARAHDPLTVKRLRRLRDRRKTPTRIHLA